MPLNEKDYLDLVRRLQGHFVPWGGLPKSEEIPPAGGEVQSPVNLTADWQIDLKLQWDPPAGGESVEQYKILIYASRGGTLYRQDYRKTTSYSWTYDMHKQDVSGVDPEVYVEVAAQGFSGNLSAPVGLVVANAVPSTPSKPTLLDSFETLVMTASWATDIDLVSYKWSIEEDSGTGYSEVSGSPFEAGPTYQYVGTTGYTYRVRVKVRDLYDQESGYSPYSDPVTLAAIGPDDLTEDIYQLSVSESEGGHSDAELAELYNAIYADGPSWTYGTSDIWIEYAWPVQHIVSQIMFWMADAYHVYFAISEDGSTWQWLAAEADHTGGGALNDVLVSKASQSAAQTDYLAAASGKNRYVLPVQKFIKKARVYLMQSAQVHEILWWKLVAADEIRAGVLASVNLSATAGSYFDLIYGTFKMGGTSSPRLSFDGTNLGLIGTITITGGSGIAQLSDAGALATVDDLDGVPNGSTYEKTRATIIGAGYIRVGSGTYPGSFTGVAIDNTYGISGRSAGTMQFQMLHTDGFAKFGGGVCKLKNTGIEISMGTSNPNMIKWYDGTTLGVKVYGHLSGGYYYGRMKAEKGAYSGQVYVGASTTDSRGVAYLNTASAYIGSAGNLIQLSTTNAEIQFINSFGYLFIRTSEPSVLVSGQLGLSSTDRKLRCNLTHIEWYNGTSWVQLD